MSIQKRYLKGTSLCRVRFEIPEEISDGITEASLVGEFNAWSKTAHPMKRRKNGSLAATLDLEKGRAYQFRYLLGGSIWKNEPQADKSVPSPYRDSRNSVVVV